MSNTTIGKMYAVLIGTLGVAGLFVSGHLFQVTNTDMMLDIVRILLAGFLVYATFIAKSEKLATNGLMVTAVLYIGMAVWGLMSSTLGGLLPSGLTGFDIAFHVVTGIAAAAAAMRYGKSRSHAHA